MPGKPSTSFRAEMLFLSTFLVGWAFFLLPLPFRGQLTVPFDVVISSLRQTFPEASRGYTLMVALLGGLLTLLGGYRERKGLYLPPWLREFRTSGMILGWRILGGALALLYSFRLTPVAWTDAGIPQFIWATLSVSVALIIPIGAVVVQWFVAYGGLEFVGVLAQPVMRPLFRLPGRAALDALASWVGSYSVGLYLTRSVYRQGGYTKREVVTIATCFSTVSMGFVGVVAATLDLLPIFPLVVCLYFLCVVVLAVMLVRMPPINRVPDEYFSGIKTTSTEAPEACERLWRRAWRAALDTAKTAPPFFQNSLKAFRDGLVLASSILGTVIAVGTVALLIAEFTPMFHYLGQPLVPLLKLLGFQEATEMAPALLIGITEMYIPALLVADSGEAARFFVAVLSVSQLIFFSSLGPMMMDMFRDVPIRMKDLLILFGIRTAVLIPFLGGVVRLLVALGILKGG